VITRATKPGNSAVIGLKTLAAAAALVTLQGCVAALVPLAAGAAMAPSISGDGKAVSADTDQAALADQTQEIESLAIEPQAAPSAADADGNLSGAAAPKSELALNLPTASDSSFGRIEVLSATALPAPGGANLVNTQGPVDQFLSYSLAQAALAEADEIPRSARLSNPSQLKAERRLCGRLPLAVAIDLDPGRETFDPLADVKRDAELSAALAEMRKADIAIFWLSRLGANFADPLHQALAEANLDPAQQDSLVLMRELAERKQTRREKLSESHCLIAILGDTHHDFDELYLYLRNPDAAVGLEPMIGQGWFLYGDLMQKQSDAR
jgi:hypothetical protein